MTEPSVPAGKTTPYPALIAVYAIVVALFLALVLFAAWRGAGASAFRYVGF